MFKRLYHVAIGVAAAKPRPPIIQRRTVQASVKFPHPPFPQE